MAETLIHPTAVVEPGAALGAAVRIGPFCHVGPEAVLEDGVELLGHVTVMGATTLGAGTRVFPQAVLGAPPQNAKHRGGRTTLTIGRNCIIREGATMHTGTDTSRGATVVGDNGNFLAFTHVAHDCIVGSGATFANGATLGGHCEIGQNVSIGGLTAVHQFVRIGEGAFIGGCSAVTGDVIPFAIAMGNRAKLRGLNLVGLRRSGMSGGEIRTLQRAYRVLFDHATPFAENLDRAKSEFAGIPLAMQIVSFLADRGKRHLTVPPLRGGRQDDDDDA